MVIWSMDSSTAQPQEAPAQPIPQAVPFNPPAPLHPVDEEGEVIKEHLTTLVRGQQAALLNPWSEEDRYLVGTVRGGPDDFVLEVGRSIGKLSTNEEGHWGCDALVQMGAIASGLAQEAAKATREAGQSYTQKLLKRTGKKKKKG